MRVTCALLYALHQRQYEWPQIVAVIKYSSNNKLSPFRENVVTITALTDRPLSSHILTFLSKSYFKQIIVTEAQRERDFNTSKLVSLIYKPHPIVKNHANEENRGMRECRSREQLADCHKVDFVLVACDQSFRGTKLCLR